MTSSSGKTREKIEGLEREIRSLKRALLAPRGEEDRTLDELQALIMQVSGRRVALPVEQVGEVVPMVLVTPLPGAPAAVRGTISYRGQLVPVLDLSQPLAGTMAPLSPGQFLVMTGEGQNQFALVIDQVGDVLRFSFDDIESAPMTGSLPGFVHTVLRLEHESVILFDPGCLLAAGELDLLHKLLAEIASAGEDPK